MDKCFLWEKLLNYEEEEPIQTVLHLLGEPCVIQDCLHQLREVEPNNFNGKVYELDMVRFLLVRSLAPKKMVIQPRKGTIAAENLNFLKEVTRFKRVSRDAKIIYLDPDEMHVLHVYRGIM
ncbi:hypothetical protein REPUB_Repub01dG0035800 [Reevesia pubescens]